MSDVTDPEELALRKSLKLERYADILAHVVHFGTERTAEVVRRFGFTLEQWSLVDRAWSRELSLGIKRQQHDQGLRFSATFHKRRQRLATEQPAIDAIGDAAPPQVAVAPPAPAPAKAPAESVALPSFMVTPPKPAAAPIAGRPPTLPSMPMPAEEPLPFVGRTPAAALESALAHAEIVQGPKVVKPPVQQGSTAPMNERLAALARQHLPFGTPAAPAPAPEQSDNALGSPESRLPLSMEQHASLRVELEVYPDRSAAILQRYGLRAEKWASVDAGWQARIDDDPHLRAAWEKASAQYRAWLLQTKGP